MSTYGLPELKTRPTTEDEMRINMKVTALIFLAVLGMSFGVSECAAIAVGGVGFYLDDEKLELVRASLPGSENEQPCSTVQVVLIRRDVNGAIVCPRGVEFELKHGNTVVTVREGLFEMKAVLQEAVLFESSPTLKGYRVRIRGYRAASGVIVELSIISESIKLESEMMALGFFVTWEDTDMLRLQESVKCLQEKLDFRKTNFVLALGDHDKLVKVDLAELFQALLSHIEKTLPRLSDQNP